MPTVLKNKAILYNANEDVILLPNYRQDVNNPRCIVPDFPDCVNLNFEMKVNPKCGRVDCRYKCTLTDETVSVPHCRNVCQVCVLKSSKCAESSPSAPTTDQ